MAAYLSIEVKLVYNETKREAKSKMNRSMRNCVPG